MNKNAMKFATYVLLVPMVLSIIFFGMSFLPFVKGLVYSLSSALLMVLSVDFMHLKMKDNFFLNRFYNVCFTEFFLLYTTPIAIVFLLPFHILLLSILFVLLFCFFFLIEYLKEFNFELNEFTGWLATKRMWFLEKGPFFAGTFLSIIPLILAWLFSMYLKNFYCLGVLNNIYLLILIIWFFRQTHKNKIR